MDRNRKKVEKMRRKITAKKIRRPQAAAGKKTAAKAKAKQKKRT